jgi:hypothetical protein
MIEDSELRWGEPSVDISIIISLHFDIRGPTCFPDVHRAHDLRTAFLFLTGSWYEGRSDGLPLREQSVSSRSGYSRPLGKRGLGARQEKCIYG